MIKSAEFSSCGKYRYVLRRIWNPHAEKAMCIGLNPSTANADKDDPTIRRLISDLTHLGYGGLAMCNLYALVASKPGDLFGHVDPMGDNEKWLKEISEECEPVIFCWGNFPPARYRAGLVAKMFPDAKCFGHTANGSPMHPLALMYMVVSKFDVVLRKFNNPNKS
jgi:hypothetical protein